MGWKIIWCQSIHNLQNKKDLATLLFSVNPSVSIVLFLTGQSVPWSSHLAGAQNIWGCQRWTQQDPHLAGSPRNSTFTCCGLQGSVGAKWTWRETFPAAWWLLKDLLKQNPCRGWLSSWWQHMAAREDGKSTGKCSPETWVRAWQGAGCCSGPRERSQTLLLETPYPPAQHPWV